MAREHPYKLVMRAWDREKREYVKSKDVVVIAGYLPLLEIAKAVLDLLVVQTPCECGNRIPYRQRECDKHFVIVSWYDKEGSES